MKTLVAVLMVLSSAVVLAAPPGARQVAQQARINQGIRSGQLTPREAARLEAQHQRLERHLVRDRLDGGGLSAGERARLQAEQNRLSRRIAVQKHDAQRW